MHMAEGKKKKNNRPVSIPKRNKQSYAQYVWIRQLYNEIDTLKKEISKIEHRVSEMERTAKYLSDQIEGIVKGEKHV
jgi:predicted  nucleic acid-binding Zn-ribbon protein